MKFTVGKKGSIVVATGDGSVTARLEISSWNAAIRNIGVSASATTNSMRSLGKQLPHRQDSCRPCK